MPRPDCYISVDVETDGPIPGTYSMLSFGASLVGTWDGVTLERPALPTGFYRELRPTGPLTMPERAAVSHLDRDALLVSGADPVEAMTSFSAWVKEVAGDAKPVLVAYPLPFDWMFLYWYLVTFSADGSPFGHSNALDIKSFYAARARKLVSQSTKRSMPRFLKSALPHTHNALDDATEQGELFANILLWTPTT